MPTIFRQQGVAVRFFSNEGSPREPMHVHCTRPGAEAKIWLEPEISVARNVGYNAAELASLVRLIRQRRQEIEDEWNAFFGQEP